MTLSLWGFAGYLLLYLAVVTGTAVSSPWLRRHLPMAARSSGTHTILSLAGLVASAVHTLKSVASPQGDQFAPLVFLGSTGPLDPALALGVAGLYAFLVSTAVVYFRHALAGPVWRIAHALAYPAFAAAAWHGIALGANTWLPEAQAMYGVTLASAAALAAARFVELSIRFARGRPRGHRAPARTR
jgi:predicted ferric reductase